MRYAEQSEHEIIFVEIIYTKIIQILRISFRWPIFFLWMCLLLSAYLRMIRFIIDVAIFVHWLSERNDIDEDLILENFSIRIINRLEWNAAHLFFCSFVCCSRFEIEECNAKPQSVIINKVEGESGSDEEIKGDCRREKQSQYEDWERELKE